MKKFLICSIFLNLLLILAACSGVSTGAAAGAHAMKAYFNAVPGFYGQSGNQVTSFDFSLVPKAHAQVSSSISFSGSYSGFCPSVTAVSGVSAFVLYGGGDLSTSTCGTFYQGADAGLSAAQATVTASANSGELVIGNGTIGPLVAYADSSNATVRVFVNRNGQVIDSGLAATLNGNRGSTSSTFAVQDGDRLIVTGESNAPSTNLSFILAKQ
ncbi:MAG TPA: hypothetical protein VLW06_07535 [Terriglobales bacterium]|nr:hypothetical protein [Terriglobales bacterium]